MLYVTNRTSKGFADRWNGLPFQFPPNEKVPVPPEAAAHFFGFGLEDRSRAWKRQGFTTERDGQEFLKSFLFSTDEPKPLEPTPAPQPELTAASVDEPIGLPDSDPKAAARRKR